MPASGSKPRLTSLAPQFLVDDLAGAIGYYRDVLELHLKKAPKTIADRAHRRDCEHLDAYAGVADIDAFYTHCVAKGAKILKPLTPTPWGTKDFYLIDPEGYILGFGGAIAPQ